MLRVILASWLGVAAAQGQPVSESDRFRLFNECRPMTLSVEGLRDAVKEIGLTEERLRLATESRLRAARLYTDSSEAASSANLYVNVNVVSRAYCISLEYGKEVFDPATFHSVPTMTWNSGSTGTYGLDAGFIVQNLSEHLDRFLAAYLRVNEPACGQR